MTRLLLDTTFLIDAERGDEILESVIADDDDVAIAAITVAELLVGVQLSGGRRQTARHAFVDDVVDSLPIVSYDSRTAVEHAALLVAARQAGRPRGAHDLIIAATARASGRSIVSADISAFADLPGVAVHDGGR